MVTLTDLVETSSRVAAVSGRLEKVALLAALLRRLEAAEVEIGTAYLTGSIRQSRLGVGYATIASLAEVAAAESPALDLIGVDAALEEIGQVSGKGLGSGKVETAATALGPGHTAGAGVPGPAGPR